MNRDTIATNMIAPRIDHTMGNWVPSMLTVQNKGKLNAEAIQYPIYAPTAPSTVETRQPPAEYPTIACAIAPQIAAITSKSKKPNMDIYNSSLSVVVTICRGLD